MSWLPALLAAVLTLSGCLSEGLYAKFGGSSSTSVETHGPERAGGAVPGAPRLRALLASMPGGRRLVVVACSDGHQVWLGNCVDAIDTADQVRALDGRMVPVTKREHTLVAGGIEAWLELRDPAHGVEFFSWPPENDLRATPIAAGAVASDEAERAGLEAAMRVQIRMLVPPVVVRQSASADLDGDGRAERLLMVDALDQNVSLPARALFVQPGGAATPVFVTYSEMGGFWLRATVDLAGDGTREVIIADGAYGAVWRYNPGALGTRGAVAPIAPR